MAPSTLKDSPVEESISAITTTLKKIELQDAPDSHLVDTRESVATLVETLYSQPTAPPSLYIDLEGENLSRHGSVSILQIFVRPTNQTYLVDIHVLQDTAFSTQDVNGHTLKEILESKAIPKVFFDVRNDSDALYSHFKISLSGIQDLQLMELATRHFAKRFINGLAKCIERDAPLTWQERTAWKAAKDKGVKLFAPEHGGSYQVFNERPLSEEIRLYCVQDVKFLPRLWSYYDAKLTSSWRKKVDEASKDRVAISQTAEFNGKGQHMAMAPRGWAY